MPRGYKKDGTPSNPSGKGGFGDNPDHMNKGGSIPKAQQTGEILKELRDKVPFYLPPELEGLRGKEGYEDLGEKTYAELIAIVIMQKALAGNDLAIDKYLNRTEGRVKEVLEVGRIGEHVPDQKKYLDKYKRKQIIEAEVVKEETH